MVNDKKGGTGFKGGLAIGLAMGLILGIAAGLALPSTHVSGSDRNGNVVVANVSVFYRNEASNATIFGGTVNGFNATPGTVQALNFTTTYNSPGSPADGESINSAQALTPGFSVVGIYPHAPIYVANGNSTGVSIYLQVPKAAYSGTLSITLSYNLQPG